jgi:hypothetical protein
MGEIVVWLRWKPGHPGRLSRLPRRSRVQLVGGASKAGLRAVAEAIGTPLGPAAR